MGMDDASIHATLLVAAFVDSDRLMYRFTEESISQFPNDFMLETDTPLFMAWVANPALKECGVMAEFDLEFTSDGYPVLLHDDTVNRTTEGTGDISQMTWKDVQGLDAAAKFPHRDKFPLERIPLLEDAVKLCLELGVKIFIDVKRCHPKLGEVLRDLFQKYEALYNNAAVCSFYPQVIYEVKKADPRIIVGHTWRPGFFAFKDIQMTEPRFGVPQFWLAQIFDRINIWAVHNVLFKFTGASLILTQTKCISRFEKFRFQVDKS